MEPRQSSTFWCSGPFGLTEAASFLLLMNTLTFDLNAASSVAQTNQGRARGLGRGPRSISNLQSPYVLKDLRILQCNINGLTTTATRIKLDQLIEIAEDKNVQVIAVQETKLKKNTDLKIKGYNIYRVDRASGGGGGLAFFIKDVKYQSIDFTTDQTSDLEIQGIKIAWRGKSLNIINVYHPPNQKQLPSVFNNVMDKNTIILGDLNAKHAIWGCSSNNDRGEDILQAMDDKEFMILNDGTHTHSSYSYNTSEALDIALTSSDIFPQCSWSVLGDIGSDHLPVLIEFKKKQRVYLNREKFWNFKKANWVSFRNSIDTSLTPLTNNLNEDWLIFRRMVIDSAKLNIPRGNVKRYVPSYTHNTPIIKSLLDKKKELIGACNGRVNSTRTELNKINAEIKKSYAYMKRIRWKEMCSKLDARTSNSKLWQLVKSINNEQDQSENCNSVTDSNGQAFPDDKEAANGLAAHYQSSSRLNFTRENKSVLKKARNVIHGCRSTDKGGLNMSKPFTLRELLLAMAFLDLRKSPGPDGLHGQMLENLSYAGKYRLLDIFNLSWKSGRLPYEWKRATVIPVKKPGKRTSTPEDFRPIALTCISCKILEKMILFRIQFYLDNKQVLPVEQYGFRRGHSTTDQVLLFCQSIRDAQNLKPTHHTVAALLDLTKAFDRVWKHKLIIKLHDTFNIRGNILTWISDFLLHRYIRVKVNKTFSSSFELSQGVPQGSVLSPTLFTMFLTGIEKMPSIGVKIGLFADDIVIWCSGTDIRELELKLNDSLTALSNYASELKLVFNPTKSIATFFTTNRHLYNYRPKLRFDDKELTYEKHPKYLGYILDPEITGHKHIEHLILKSRRRLNILKYIAGRDWGADAATLRITYLTLIRPILEYGFPIYCCASNTNLKKLEQVQLSAARIITGLRRSCPSEIVLFEADLQPLQIRRQAGLVKYYNKLSSYGQHNNTSKYLNNWRNQQRLKKNSPFSQVAPMNIPYKEVEPYSLTGCLDPSEGLPEVHFHFNFSTPVCKNDFIPDHLKNLALETINSIPKNAIKIYTDGSKINKHSGSGIYIETPQEKMSFSLRNPDSCSVFRSELIAIERGLEAVLPIRDYGDLWILSDSRSSIQHLNNWYTIGDKTSISILSKLRHISMHHGVHVQWIPSHVDIHGNEIADKLAKEGCRLAPSSSALTYLELHSLKKSQGMAEWLVPPTHHWYLGKKPGMTLSLASDRDYLTALSRLASGHLSCLSFCGNRKVFDTCTKCHAHQASAEHILACVGLSRDDIYSNPLLVMDFLKVNGLMDLV